MDDAAKAIWGPASELGRTWTAARHDQLDRGELKALVSALRVHAATEPTASAARQTYALMLMFGSALLHSNPPVTTALDEAARRHLSATSTSSPSGGAPARGLPVSRVRHR